MPRRTPFTVLVFCAALTGCSDGTPTPRVDSAPPTCSPVCGPNATCRADLTCACEAGSFDCNGDLAQGGGDGCECVTGCSGAVCKAAPVDCRPDTYQACGTSALYCNVDACTRCPLGKANCDGVQDCERTGTCTAECTTEGGCGDETKRCKLGKCVGCDAGEANCDLYGACECTGTCSGGVCQGTTVCDYYDQQGCGKDQGKWCYTGTCRDCSSGRFNCNGTKGCECDSAGCSGSACAGKCSGGECS